MAESRVAPVSVQRLRCAVLGPLRVWRGDELVDLGPIRQQAVFAALLLRPDTTVSQQEILDGVWGSDLPRSGSNVVSVYVYRLRKALQRDPADGDVIRRDRSGYRLDGSAVATDLAQLDELTAEANAADANDAAAAMSAYAAALALYRGEPLAGLPGPFATGQRRRLAERRITLLQESLDLRLRLGQFGDAVGELSALTEQHPHSEAMAALLMRALHGSGRQVDALAVFTRIRRRLVDDLGVEPGEDLRQVQRKVLRGSRERPREKPRTTSKARNELPIVVGELAGREHELAQLITPPMAGAVTLDAVDGVAGSGKTALAVHAANAIATDYPDGCLFVDLRGHREGAEPLAPHRALRRLLRSVGANNKEPTANEPTANELTADLDDLVAAWRAATKSLRLLLVLDDVANAEQVRPLLPAGAGSRVLLTSRQRLLGLDADHRISPGPLAPEAAEGLLSRIVGRRVEEEPTAIRELARLCGGLPLALRIVGARLQAQPTGAVERLLTRMADDERRLGELTAGDRSVATALRLSYEQLATAEQRAFRLLGLSPTATFDQLTLAAMLGCPVADAERILEDLADANLLLQPASARYRLHDLVALFARRLVAGEEEQAVTAARVGVFGLYLTAAQYSGDGDPPATAEGWFADRAEANAWLDAAAGELVDVVEQAAALRDAEHAGGLAEALQDYLTRRGRFHEFRSMIETVLPLAEEVGDLRMAASLRINLGNVYGMQGYYEQAHDWMRQALDLARRADALVEQARALGGLGATARLLGKQTEAVEYLTEMTRVGAELDDARLSALALTNLGVAYHQLRRHDEALDAFTQAITFAGKLGDQRGICYTLLQSADLHLDLERYADAAELLRRASELAEEIGDIPAYAFALTRLGTAEQHLGRSPHAIELHHKALAAVTEQTGIELELEIRNRLGDTQLAAGAVEAAREQFTLALAITETHSNPIEHDRALNGLRRCDAFPKP